MTDTLTTEQIAEIEALLAKAFGVRLHGKETARQELLDATPALIAMAREALVGRELIALADRGLAHYRQRAEKAEAERDRYREMAVSLASCLALQVKTRDEGINDYPLPGAVDLLSEPDIAALLEEENGNG